MENKLSLYSISERFVELFNRDDLTEEEFIEQGNILGAMLQNKSENIVGYNFTLESNKNVVKSEIERLQGICKAIEERQDKFNKYVKENMEKLGLEKIPTAIGNLTIKKNPASVNIIDETLIGPEYIKEKITTSIDKTKIKEDIKKGLIVLGAELVETNTRLEIK